MLKKSKTQKIKTPSVLKIEDDNGIRELLPGDFYDLTLTMDVKTGSLTGLSKISARYQWDGKVLKRVYV